MENLQIFINNNKARPQERKLRPLFLREVSGFSNVPFSLREVGEFSNFPLLNQYREDSGEGACGLSSISVKTRTANPLQTS